MYDQSDKEGRTEDKQKKNTGITKLWKVTTHESENFLHYYKSGRPKSLNRIFINMNLHNIVHSVQCATEHRWFLHQLAVLLNWWSNFHLHFLHTNLTWTAWPSIGVDRGHCPAFHTLAGGGNGTVIPLQVGRGQRREGVQRQAIWTGQPLFEVQQVLWLVVLWHIRGHVEVWNILLKKGAGNLRSGTAQSSYLPTPWYCPNQKWFLSTTELLQNSLRL